jgi:integrase
MRVYYSSEDGALEIEPLIDRHLAWMRLSNKRPLTIYARERVLVRLTKWAQGPVLYLTEEQLAAYQVWRSVGDAEHEPIASSSQRVEVSHLREFYSWAVRERLRNDDPTSRLVMPKRKDYEARPLEDKIFAAALEEAEPHMAAILALARYAGLRACEIARLDWRDLRLGAKPAQLTVREGKGGYSRDVHLATPLVEILRAVPGRSGPVIPCVDGRAGYNTAARISQRAGAFLHEKVGVDRGQTLHALRHAFGTSSYRAKKDMVSVQAEMGHRTIATTRVYIKGTDQARAEMVEAASKLQLDEAS